MSGGADTVRGRAHDMSTAPKQDRDPRGLERKQSSSQPGGVALS
jgi:hypothetical protein